MTSLMTDTHSNIKNNTIYCNFAYLAGQFVSGQATVLQQGRQVTTVDEEMKDLITCCVW